MKEPAGGDFTLFEHRTVALLYFTAGLLGVFGNAVLIRILSRDKPISGSRARLHVHFAFANILVVVGCFFSGLSSVFGKWLFGPTGCQVYGTVTYTGGMAATSLGPALCVQRYLAQGNPKYDQGGASGALSLLSWMYALIIAAGPLLGWNSYSAESAGTACGLEWQVADWSHHSMFFVLVLVSCGLLFFATMYARAAIYGNAALKDACIAVANMAITGLGFTPYFYFALWALKYPDVQMTALASVLPPLAAKISTVFVPLVYVVANRKFRNAFTSMVFGGQEDTASGGRRK
ncbi:OPSX-like protein, partial [Mya arenaria]